MTRARFPWGLTVASAVLFIGLVALGVWQVQRLQWKDKLIAEAKVAARRPPQPLTTVLSSSRPEFRQVAFDCPGLAGADFAEVITIEQGQAGYRLVSSCRLPDGGRYGSVFVDRGFVAETAPRPSLRSTGAWPVIGVLRTLPSNDPIRSLLFSNDPGDPMSWREPAVLSSRLKADRPAPFTVYALNSSNPELTALRPSAPPAAFSNNHLGYAITWFGLALTLAGFYIALLRRKLKS